MDFNAAKPSSRGSANTFPDPPSSLQGVVDAAKEAAQIPTTPTVTPQEQFIDQFGSKQPTTPPVTETSILTDIKPSVVENPGSTAEIALQPEDPQATFVQDIKTAVSKLEEATKDKAVA